MSSRRERWRRVLVSSAPRARKVLRALFLYGLLPLTVLLVLLHYPYDTDASVAARGEGGESKSSGYYEAAYRPGDSGPRGIDYEETAAREAKKADVEGTVRRFAERYGLKGKRVLDVGSGRGYLQDIVDDYTGLDISSKVAPYYHKPFVVGSATEMPFPDASFDGAWSIWVIEHIPQPEKVFREIRRILKPGGILFLVPAWNCTPWAAQGFEVRPYSDFNFAGKVVKASIPIRRSAPFVALYQTPTRLLRWMHYGISGDQTPFHFRAIEPNYEVYWQPDSDAVNTLDRFEALLWFRSRGDECLSCEGMIAEWMRDTGGLVIKRH